jgi:hypothetical protein
MAPSDHPEPTPAATGIQTPAGLPSSAEAPSIPLPPLLRRPIIDEAKVRRLSGWLDAALVVAVVLFAFLVASFPAGNPDFFRQVATGRLLTHGEYHFGVDPFVFTAGNDYFVNHSWLFALMLYGLYQLPGIGEPAVVIFKALLIAALAGVLLRAGRRAGQSLWIPAACTALAILALSPRLYLQSVCLSYLFLALTLWLLFAGWERRPAGAADQAGTTRLWWLLPPLFALWVNCDQWFFLGPLTVALFLAGALIQHWLPAHEEEPQEPWQRELGMLGAVLVVGVAACLLNPHHVRAFRLPAELGLSPANDLIEHDPHFRILFVSPLRKIYYQPALGLSVAGLAYWPLVLAGLASFAFTSTRLSWPRLLPWAGFALLSLYNARTIPFFAIVAGPITALNWLDYAAARLAAPVADAPGSPRLTAAGRNWALGGRVLTLLALVLLAVAGVPGWLQAQPHDYRRLGWSVRVDASLEAMARTIHDWRRANRLPDEPNWFNARPAIADYLAWYAPGERVFLDSDLPNFRGAAEDYLSVREGLEQSDPSAKTSGDAASVDVPSMPRDWRKVLRNRKVHFWIFEWRPSLHKAELAAQELLFSQPDEWVPCYLKGHIAIFAWRDPRDKSTSEFAEKWKLDWKRLAFGAEAEPAPPRGPEIVTALPEGWDAWRRAKPAVSPDRETARLHEVTFHGLQDRYLNSNSRAWQAAVEVSAIGQALPFGPMPNSLLAINWSCTYSDLFPAGVKRNTRQLRPEEMGAIYFWREYVGRQNAGPPECLYLAIRAARRALLDNPEDPDAYRLLGHAYLSLLDQTQEKFLPPQLGAIRQTQMVAAFQNCLLLKPEPGLALEAHYILYEAFHHFHYDDVALTHLRAVEELRAKLERMPGGLSPKISKLVAKVAPDLKQLEREVSKHQDNYDVAAANKPVLEKVTIALEEGLAETALNALQQAAPEDLPKDISGSSVEVVSRMMDLTLRLGRLNEARQLLMPDPEKMAGKPVSPKYLEYHVRLAAARGDYEEADRRLVDALDDVWKDAKGKSRNAVNQDVIGTVIGQVLLEEARPLFGAPRLPWVPQPSKQGVEMRLLGQIPSRVWVRGLRLAALKAGVEIQEERTNWLLMRGWLALESGRCREARQHFRAALDEQVMPATWLPAVHQLQILPENSAPTQVLIQLGMLRQQQGRTRNWIGHYLHQLHQLDDPAR